MEDLYDVVIIGGGPAGLTAAIYLTRAKYRVLVLEKEEFGGQITISYEVVNYPGVEVCSGKELTDVMYRQAEYFGTEFLKAKALKLNINEDVKIVHTNKGDFRCLGILLATGAHPRTIGFKGEDEFKGRGVAYCATCDGEFFTGKEVFVIGGGYAAAEESIFLTKYASHVTILIREEDFTCAKAVADQARSNEKISVITDTEVEEVSGDSVANYIRYKNNKTGKITEHRAKNGDNIGVFVFAGYEPETKLVENVAQLDNQGYIITDSKQQTSVKGLYAAGDICIKPLRQVVTATGDGALAATEMERYVSKVRQATGLKTLQPMVKSHESIQKSKSTQNFNRQLDEMVDEKKFLNSEMKRQLSNVFSQMKNVLVLKLYLDDSMASKELREYVTELGGETEKLSMEVVEDNKTKEKSENKTKTTTITNTHYSPGNEKRYNTANDEKHRTINYEYYKPCVRIFRENGEYTGVAFHGVPGGHEFTSFVLGLYNAAGPGQKLEQGILERINNLDKKLDIKILVSLSCTMCPELVIAAQHIAALSSNVISEVYDIRLFEELRHKYKVMSVPCMIVNRKIHNEDYDYENNHVHEISSDNKENVEQVFFGKKNLVEVLEILENISEE